MIRIVQYRQYWMATLKARNSCETCGNLAINALEVLDQHGTCVSVSWYCDQDLPAWGIPDEERESLWN
jgi:hypothetical protein